GDRFGDVDGVRVGHERSDGERQRAVARADLEKGGLRYEPTTQQFQLIVDARRLLRRRGLTLQLRVVGNALEELVVQPGVERTSICGIGTLEACGELLLDQIVFADLFDRTRLVGGQPLRLDRS